MTASDDFILALSDGELLDLASALRSGRVSLPPNAVGLVRILGVEEGQQAATSLQAWAAAGLSAAQAAWALELLVRSRRTQPAKLTELVLTGPTSTESAARDTAAVVHELFAQAQRSVMVIGYAVHKGQRVFKALADRMAVKPDLAVEMFLDVQLQPFDAITPEEAVARFRQRFLNTEWPTGYPCPACFVTHLPLKAGVTVGRAFTLNAWSLIGK